MKILLIYYTGTYNTRYVTNKLKARLENEKFKVDTLEVNIDTKPVTLNDYDIIGIGYPIYAFNSPNIFNKYLRKINFLSEKRYFIYKNSGETLELNNVSSRVIISILKKYKCKLSNEYHIVMPYNIHFRFDDAFVKEILLYLDKMLEIIAYDLVNNIENSIEETLKNKFISSLYTLQRLGGPVNSLFYKIDYTKCVKCHICMDNCPVHNITFKNGKYKFHQRCLMCMRCSFYCPKDAIKIGLYDKWRVNGKYDFEKIKNNDTLKLPYITEQSDGFYKCFIKTFKDIDERYKEIKKDENLQKMDR